MRIVNAKILTIFVFFICEICCEEIEVWYEKDINHKLVNDTKRTPLIKEYCPDELPLGGWKESLYKESCNHFARCGHAFAEITNWFTDQKHYQYLTIRKCEACPKNIRNTPECPNGLNVFNPATKKCLPPSRVPEEDNPCGKRAKPTCSGPQDTDDLHRIGKTNYYIFQNAERTNLVDWYGAKTLCESVGLELAKIDNLQTEVLVGRELEKFIISRGWIDNFYWMNAKFDRSLKTYVWQDTMEPLNFSNFYYRPPRPKGYGDFFDIKGNFISDPTIEHCLAFSMPLPFPKTHNTPTVPYGFHTSWWERQCKSSKKGNVLCQSPDIHCQEARNDSIFTESSGDYYEELWPMSNRRFVVMWHAKSFDEAKAVCEEYKMKLYSPHEEDTCLSKNLKNWMKTVTSYSFWTDIKYEVEGRKFVYQDGKEVPLGVQNVTSHIRDKRDATNEIKDTCVSVTWNFEEHPKNINFCNCTTDSVVMSPENCLNKIGVICQLNDDETRACTEEYFEKAPKPFELITFDANTEHPKIKEFYPFNSNPSWQEGIIRSAYKQQGSAGQCPEGFKRITRHDTYWGSEEDFEKSSYTYDFLAPYWLKMQNSTCSLSTVSYSAEDKKLTQTITEEDCTRWLGFVLCKPKPVKLDSKGRAIAKQRAVDITINDDDEETNVGEPD